jgi:hypothetical protein
MASLDHGSWGREPESRASDVPRLAPVNAFPRIPVRGLSGTPAYVSGVEGPERIAPPGGPPQGDSPILPGGIRDWRLEPAPVNRRPFGRARRPPERSAFAMAEQPRADCDGRPTPRSRHVAERPASSPCVARGTRASPPAQDGRHVGRSSLSMSIAPADAFAVRTGAGPLPDATRSRIRRLETALEAPDAGRQGGYRHPRWRLGTRAAGTIVWPGQCPFRPRRGHPASVRTASHPADFV